MKYTAGEAAKAVGVSTATISRALKSGKISGSKDESGAWQIDPSELYRVYQDIASQEPVSTPTQSHATPNERNALQGEMDVLRERLRAAETMQAAAEADRDAWRDQAERLAKALPAPTTPKPYISRSRWRWPWHRS